MKSVQDQINELHKQMAALRESQKAEHLEEIRSMEWLKGKTVRFEQGFLAAGLPEFTLILNSKNPKVDGVLGYGGSINLYGDHKLYEYNITLRSKDVWGFNVYSMETSSVETLHQFIKMNDLKIDVSDRYQLLYQTLLDHAQNKYTHEA